jgi:hypothetical protein
MLSSDGINPTAFILFRFNVAKREPGSTELKFHFSFILEESWQFGSRNLKSLYL